MNSFLPDHRVSKIKSQHFITMFFVFLSDVQTGACVSRGLQKGGGGAANARPRKVVLDGKTFAPFGMVPHAVEPEKVQT